MHRLLPFLLLLVVAGCSSLTRAGPVADEPVPPQFCTRSLGTVDCWSNPAALTGPPARGVADGPQTLTPAQEANRRAWWLHL